MALWVEEQPVVYDGLGYEESEWEPWVCSSRFGTVLGWGLAVLGAAILARVVVNAVWGI